MDLPPSIVAHPERPSAHASPESRHRRAPGSWRDTAGLRIDLLDAILGELIQVLAVEGRPRMRSDVDRAQDLPARRIEGVQRVSGSKPDVMAVGRDAMDVVDTRKGSILRTISAVDRLMAPS